ncbi:MAG: hypothetical protein HYU64_15970 [Armatimonadetes bacterium]|nr:hypothetical protein [Armatimonadota bacterium]
MGNPCDAPSKALVRNLGKSEKFYSFNDDKDPDTLTDHFFQHTHEGLTSFVIFYTLACRYGRCLGCNLPSLQSSKPVGLRSLIRQMDTLFEKYYTPDIRSKLYQIIVSNNGSVLDEVTFPSTALVYLVAQANLHLPGLRLLTLETRVEYVDMIELEFLSRALKEGEVATDLEIAVGFEAFDEHIRNKYFRKSLTKKSFKKMVLRLAHYGFRLKCYFMLKPVPGLTDEEAVADVISAVHYLSSLADYYGISINIHLNPTFVARGTPLETAFKQGDYTPPHLADVLEVVKAGRGKNLTIFVGLNDEGLAVPGGSFRRPGDESLIALLDEFNRTQNYDSLRVKEYGGTYP